ncbi:MAG TPA: ribosome maturation factor RimP [Frankiaceae bacterium]|nr:ribosome maturation factor RimP [Frankiaceae bacterium]
MGNDAVRTQLFDLLLPVTEKAGLDLEDVAVNRAGSRSVVRVVVDADGGLDLDAVAEVSRSVSEVLDAADDVLRGAYVLEVTSPGVDRPLSAPRHWRRARTRKVKLVQADGREIVGRVQDAAEDESGSVTLTTDQGPVVIRYADVKRATVEVEFSPTGASGPGAGS